MSILSCRSWCQHSVIGLLLVLAAACSPNYNWREVRPSDLGLAVMLPGKPATLTQRVRLDNLDLVMTMAGAKVDDIPFTVALSSMAMLQKLQVNPQLATSSRKLM